MDVIEIVNKKIEENRAEMISSLSNLYLYQVLPLRQTGKSLSASMSIKFTEGCSKWRRRKDSKLSMPMAMEDI